MTDTMTMLTRATKMAAALPTEFSRRQYEEKFRELFPRGQITPGVNRLENSALIVKVREETFTAQMPYEEYRWSDGFCMSCAEWDSLHWDEIAKLRDAHGARDWRRYERPDLPPMEIPRVRYIYSFDRNYIAAMFGQMLNEIREAGF